MFKKLFSRDFIQELNEDYYNKYPEEWDSQQLFLDSPIYLSVFNGDSDGVTRLREKGEEVTSKYILRSKRKIWEVGKVYPVRTNLNTDITSETTQTGPNTFKDRYDFNTTGTIVGCLKLVEIKPDNSWFGSKQDELTFEKVEC